MQLLLHLSPQSINQSINHAHARSLLHPTPPIKANGVATHGPDTQPTPTVHPLLLAKVSTTSKCSYNGAEQQPGSTRNTPPAAPWHACLSFAGCTPDQQPNKKCPALNRQLQYIEQWGDRRLSEQHTAKRDQTPTHHWNNKLCVYSKERRANRARSQATAAQRVLLPTPAPSDRTPACTCPMRR